jgi:hypothetical protein
MTLKYRRVTGSLALVLVSGAVVAPAASARFDLNPPPSQPTSATQVATAPPQSVTVVKSDGFDWADAGIGAGAAVALVLTGLGARLTVGHRRHLHSSAARSNISLT